MKFGKIKLRREHLERILVGGAAALVLFLAARGTQPPMVEVPYESVPDEVATVAEPDVPMQETTLYYRDGNGYLVPVTVEVPRQEGIAKATLSLLTASTVNDMEAASLGLLTVAPEGTAYDLDISDGPRPRGLERGGAQRRRCRAGKRHGVRDCGNPDHV